MQHNNLGIDTSEAKSGVNFHDNQPGTQVVPSAPILDPEAEGYDYEAHAKFLRNQRKNAAVNQTNPLSLIRQRERVIQGGEYKKNHPTLNKASRNFQHLTSGDVIVISWNDVLLLGNVLVGGALADEAHRTNWSLNYLILLEAYIGLRMLNLVKASYKEISDTYAGIRREQKEVLAEKQLMDPREFERLDKAFFAYLEDAFNLLSMGLLMAGSTFILKSDGFKPALGLVLGSCVSQGLASVLKFCTDLRFAEELLGTDLDRDDVRMSAALRKAIVGGGIVTGVGAMMFALNPDDPQNRTAFSYAALSTLAVGLLTLFSATWRIRGSDCITYVTKNLLQLGESEERLKAFFLKCVPTRTDIADLVNATSMTLLWSVITNLIQQRNEIGYIAAAGFGFIGFISAKFMGQSLAHTEAQALDFWEGIDEKAYARLKDPESGKRVKEEKAVAKAADPDTCYTQVKGCFSRLATRFYMWGTKSNCCPPELSPEQKAAQRTGKR